MKILHIETGRNLYGGALQVMFLLRNLPNFGVENMLFCDEGSAIRKACEHAGIATFPTRIAGDLDLGLPSKIKRACKTFNPDLIHVHSRRGVDFWGGWVARRMGIPAVISRRVDNPESPWIAKRKYGMYDRVITISDGIRQVLLKEGIPDTKIKMVRSALELESYPDPMPREEFRARFAIDSDETVIACAAQLIERKGHQYLIDALPEVLKIFPKLKVLCFGKGNELGNLESQVKDLNLGSIVKFPGFVDDIKRIYPHIDILVHPARMEGLGVALIEASYAGVPIIAARAGGIPEIVRNGENGILVPPADSKAIQQSLIELLRHPEKRAEMGEKGRALAKTEFAVLPMVEGNFRVYQAILSQAM